MKRLILMRHAKSDWSEDSLSDFERPLNRRGVKDSGKMGIWMANEFQMPDIIFCSSARRAQQTKQLWLLAVQSEGIETQNIQQLDFESMYLASANTLHQIIDNHLNQHESIMLIAHYPGMDSLLLHYCPQAPFTPTGKLMTTGNIAVIDFDDDLNPTLLKLQRPRILRSAKPG